MGIDHAFLVAQPFSERIRDPIIDGIRELDDFHESLAFHDSHGKR